MMIDPMTEILTPFLAAFILAYILEPITLKLVKWRVPRSLAAFITLLFGLAIGISLLLLLLNLLQNEIPLIKKQFPHWIIGLQEWAAPKLASLDIHLDWNELRTQITQKITSQISDNANTVVTSTLDKVLQSSSSILGGLANLILVVFIIFYLLLDWKNFFETLRELIPFKYKATVTRLALEVDELLSQYLRGQLTVVVILSALYSAGLWFIGIHGGIALGVFTGLVVIIPFVGILMGLLLSTMAAFLQFGTGSQLISTLTLFGLGHTLENFFLTPRLVGERIGLHPVAVLFALMFFGQLFGFFGILLALPLSAACLVVIRFIREKYVTSEWFRSN
jgi:predicted PurR-regulated permease PerM